MFEAARIYIQTSIAFVLYFPIIDSYVNQRLAYKTTLE